MNLSTAAPRSFWQFCVREHRPLTFGLNFTFLSSFGQTFLLSLFVPYFIAYHDLSRASFGSIYSLLTLASAAVIPLVGGWIDRVPLRPYSLLVIVGLVLGALTTAFSGHVIILIPGLFLLRLAGQGLSTHTAKTAIGRFYREYRGRALSIINLGLPVGEGTLPMLVTALLGLLSWRWTLVILGTAIALVFLPLQFWLLGTSSLTDPWKPGRTTDGDERNPSNDGSLAVYRSVLREIRFWLLAPAVVLPAFWLTGLFLYQTTVADHLGWSVPLLASAFTGYAFTRIVFSLGVGPFVDRYSARVLFPFYLVPFAGALTFAYYHPGSWSAFGYMSLLGVTMGTGTSIKTALWAELYGTEVLGRIRSLFSSLVVFSTSLSPALMGWLLEAGIAVETLLAWALLTIGVSTLGAIVGVMLEPGRERKPTRSTE